MRIAAAVFLAAIVAAAMGCGKKPAEASAPDQSKGSKIEAPVIVDSGSQSARIVIEAESSAEIVPSMQLGSDTVGGDESELKRASGGKFIEILPKAGKEKGKAVYKFKIEKPGKYVMWARTFWLSGCENSFSVTLDEPKVDKAVTCGEDGTYNVWHWVPLRSNAGEAEVVYLTEGDHVLTLWNREDGTRLDQILITDDVNVRPQGIVAAP